MGKLLSVDLTVNFYNFSAMLNVSKVKIQFYWSHLMSVDFYLIYVTLLFFDFIQSQKRFIALDYDLL